MKRVAVVPQHIAEQCMHRCSVRLRSFTGMVEISKIKVTVIYQLCAGLLKIFVIRDD